MSELAGTDFMINSMESKMLWWHFNSWATDLKVSETGSRGLAHKLHDNVDPTQGGDLLFIFKSLAYLRIDVFHHAGRDIFIAFWAMAEWYMQCEWAESAIRTLSQLLPPRSHINQFTMEPLLPWKCGSLQWKHCISKKTRKMETTWAHEWEAQMVPGCLSWGQVRLYPAGSMTGWQWFSWKTITRT